MNTQTITTLAACIAMSAVVSILAVCNAWSEPFYNMYHSPKVCQKHEWGDDCPPAHAKQHTQAKAYRQRAPLTSEEYVQQQEWKYMSSKYLLRPDEKKELGQLQIDVSNVPLPVLKCFLRPPTETRAQTIEDCTNFVRWKDNLDRIGLPSK